MQYFAVAAMIVLAMFVPTIIRQFKKKPITPPTDKVTFVAAGDTLIHGAIYRQAMTRGHGEYYDFGYTFENVEYYIKKFDVKFVNQETQVNDAFPPANYPKFSTPLALGDRLVEMGFNVINTSNNHAYDMGEKSIESMLKYWNKQPVVNFGMYTGNDEVDIKYMTVNGIKMSFVGYTTATNGLTIDEEVSPHVVYLTDMETVERQIKIARANSDVVIVSCHWGYEDTNFVNRSQKNLARKFNKLGVDVVVGHHPHVIQPMAWQVDEATGHKTLVCYSLGNFISAQRKANNVLGGLLQFEIVKTYDKDGNGKISIEKPYFVPTITHYETDKCKNITNYLLSDYSIDLALQHGVKKFDKKFTLEYMESIATTIIPPEFLLYERHNPVRRR